MKKPADILESLARDGVSIWAEGSRIRFRAAKGALTSESKARLAEEKSQLLADWRERAAKEVVCHPTTHGQRALWFLYQERPDSAAYNVVVALRIRSAIDVPALKNACQALIDRHPSLRTSYAMEGMQLLQQVHGHIPVVFRIHDRSGVSLANLREEAIASSHVPFRLDTGPMMRVDLFRREKMDYILLITAHHIAVDGWSSLLLVEDLALNYCAETNAGPAPPSRPDNDVAAYARWQEELLSSAEGREHERYWTEAFAGEIPTLDLLADQPPSGIAADCGASLPIDLGADISQAVRTLASNAGTTPFVILLSAYEILLHRYTRQSTIIVGSPTYGRDHREFGDVIGDFINMIPLKAEFGGDPSVYEFLGQMRSRVLEGMQHQDYPFGLLVEKLHPVRDMARTPVFQTTFILQKFQQRARLAGILDPASTEPQLRFGGLALEPFPIPQQEGQLDLGLELADFDAGYQGHFKYNSDLFSTEMVTALRGHYLELLSAMAASPEMRISRLPLLSAAEKKQVLADWNATKRDYPHNVCLHQLIEAQVDRTPNAVAVVFDDQQMTYRELDARANQLAHHLQKRGVCGDTRVGIRLERSLEMVVGLLGILKAGGAYVPMDPSYPEARLAFMMEDAGVRMVITQKKLAQALATGDTENICLDSDWSQFADDSKDRPSPRAEAQNLAYIIYTSGSTGSPKGAMNEHRAIVNRLLWMQDEYRLTSADAVLQKTPISFDVSVWEFFWPLLAGARLVMARPDGHLDAEYLIDVIARERVSIIHFVPSMLRIFLESDGVERCVSLRDVICSGEALPSALVRRFYSRLAASLHNLYGPTEAAVDVTYWACPRQSDRTVVPIGRPVANTQCYILDANLQPVPIGVPGELHLGGVQVGRGYYNRPELTAERFIPDPFSGDASGRLYKTGDICRYLRDGNIEYLGRMDHQVKIRGVRIELGEVEAALNRNSDVREAIVAVREDRPGDQRLIGYLVARDGAAPTANDLRSALRKVLPDSMVPSAFVFLDSIALTPNGKVDRNALPVPREDASQRIAEHVAPRNQVECVMAKIWSEVLGIENVGVLENFFELGGHSLSATNLIARMRSSFHINLPLRCIFLEPTIAGLSKHILYDDLLRTYHYVAEISHPLKRLVPGQANGSRPALFLVAGFMGPDDTLLVLSRIFPHLGFDQPVFGFQPRWLDGRSKPYASVEEAALEFVAELREVQPHGPYLLGGDCAQGVVALEMARELKHQGEEVGLLVMFDSRRPSRAQELLGSLLVLSRRSMNVAKTISNLVSGKSSSRVEILRKLFRRKFGIARAKGPEESGQDNLRRLRMDYWRMILRHRVEKYSGRITMIASEALSRIDSTGGWKGVALGGLEVHLTPGDHLTRLTTHSKEFANILRECLERAQAQTTSGTAGTRDSSANVSTGRRIDDGTLILSANARH